MCILRYHCHCGLVQHYDQLLENIVDVNDSESRRLGLDHARIEQALDGDRNFSISCELGVRHPSLKAMLIWENLHIRVARLQ